MLRRLPILAILLVFGTTLVAQTPKAEEGYFMSPYGRLHILVLFAEIKFDSVWGNLDPEKNPQGSIGWKVGKLPVWREKVVAYTPEGDGWMTKYFRQASFGKFQVTGDYLDTILTIPLSTIRDQKGNVVTQEPYASNHYRRAVIARAQELQYAGLHWGSSLSEHDRWTFKGNGLPNTQAPNGRLDLVMIVWRNIHVGGLGEASGFVSQGNIGEVLGGMGTDMYSMFRTSSMLPTVIMRHEFSHMLYGGNNFHTASGGVGGRTFMSQVGGWSNMSAADACSPTWNAWDRERLGWKNPANKYVVSTHCARTGEEVNGVLEYGQPLCNEGIYVLRDFVSMGDAIKIKLPHLPAGVRNQYLWIENHRNLEGNIDHDKALIPGIYAYIQVGKDAMEGNATFAGENNYLWPLVAAGQFDFRLDTALTAYQESRRANPFTGYHYLMRHTCDKNDDNVITITGDMGTRTECEMPKALVIDGRPVPESEFTYMKYPQFGLRSVAFQPDRNNKIGLGTNPSATPLYTHSGQKFVPADNRRIYLSGLSVEILKVDAQGDATVKIRWDDFVVDQWQRWCGNILLTERLDLASGADIVLDQGWSPQLTGVVQNIDGVDVFAEPTLLELGPGSTTTIAANATLRVRTGSTLLVRKGAVLEIARNGSLVVEPGAYIYIETGTPLSANTRRGIRLEPGSLKDIHSIHKARYTGLAAAVAL